MKNNIVKQIIENGGNIKPLIIPYNLSKGTGLMNPSLFVHDNKILINLRGVQYILTHSEFEQNFQTRWGPLSYIHPETDRTLTTTNFILELDENLETIIYNKVDTTKLDVKPMWEFVGLEDARLLNWNNKFYLCGVRRDTTPNGVGRMELSEIIISNDSVKEVSRTRIEPPGEPTYCEKNWMPIVDSPFHFIKWTNPTQLVKVDMKTKTSETIHLSDFTYAVERDIRGGSSVIPWEDKYIAITHEVDLYNNELGNKDGQYYHRFVIWDRNFNILHLSNSFKFMDAQIEFCCGLGLLNNNCYITFGYQDNAAFILKFSQSLLKQLIYE